VLVDGAQVVADVIVAAMDCGTFSDLMETSPGHVILWMTVTVVAGFAERFTAYFPLSGSQPWCPAQTYRSSRSSPCHTLNRGLTIDQQVCEVSPHVRKQASLELACCKAEARALVAQPSHVGTRALWTWSDCV